MEEKLHHRVAREARERLREAFHSKGDFEMEARALAGYYGDFTSPLVTPITQLVIDCRAKGYMDIADEAIDGRYDG